MFLGLNTANRNLPTKKKATANFNAFPNDLVAPGRNFYTEIALVEYNVAQQFQGRNIASTAGGIRLPIPRKLNDHTVLSWGEASATGLGTGLAGQAARAFGGVAGQLLASGIGTSAGLVSAFAGAQINPFIFMYFKQPNYKEHQLSWSLIPSNEQESNTIRNMVNQLKAASLPLTSGLIMQYPSIALVKMYPNDIFGNFFFKPAAIMAVSVDYSGAGQPSFFKNGAPTVVNLNLHLKEIQFWDKTDYGAIAPGNISAISNSIGNIFSGVSRGLGF